MWNKDKNSSNMKKVQKHVISLVEIAALNEVFHCFINTSII